MTEPYAREDRPLCVITGAGSGLGRALSVDLCGRGVRVVGIGRSAASLQQTAALAGSHFTSVVADVSDPAAVRLAFEAARKIAPVSILINNAAVYPHTDILDETASSFMHTVGVNLGGMVGCTLEALTDMTAAGHGRILNVSSFADIAPAPCSAAYSVSKGAGRILSRALVADLGDRLPGIVITTWMPGILATDMGMADGLDPALAAQWGASLALMRDRTLNGTVFERDCEVLPPRGIKDKLKDLVRGKRPKPRQINGALDGH